MKAPTGRLETLCKTLCDLLVRASVPVEDPHELVGAAGGEVECTYGGLRVRVERAG